MQFSPIRVILLGILHNYELFELKFAKKLILNSLMNKHAGLTVFFPFFMKQMFFTMLEIFHIKNDKRFSSIFMYSGPLVYQGVLSSCKTTYLLYSIFTSNFSEIVQMSRSSSMNFPAKPWSLLFFKQRTSPKKHMGVVGQ